jgi:4-oxalocrotonate tautomerase
MPLVRIDLSSETVPGLRDLIGECLHEAMVAAFGIPRQDRFQIFTPHLPGELVFDKAFLGMTRVDVIFIQILLVRRQTPDAKLAFYHDAVRRLGEVGIRKDDIFISLVENQPEDWTAGEK